MKTTRRTFLLETGAFVAGPALADLPAPEVDPAHAFAATAVPDVERPGEPVFKIDGWSVREPGACDEIWLTLGRSWRGAWR
ncbi:hypothetical protein [Pseudorhodoferax sp.]|uniref:hypothetical protein n=1 Tax=Pseudorhodoferax sp. TaxID=1993553 RepID=UPI0039E3C454